MNLYRIIWRRNNGATYPATFHVIDSVSAADVDAANALARVAHPEIPASEMACVADGQLNAALADATAQAQAQAIQEGWDGVALKQAAQEAHDRDVAEIAARAVAAEKALAQRQATALADAMKRVSIVQPTDATLAAAGVGVVDIPAGTAVDTGALTNA